MYTLIFCFSCQTLLYETYIWLLQYSIVVTQFMKTTSTCTCTVSHISYLAILCSKISKLRRVAKQTFCSGFRGTDTFLPYSIDPLTLLEMFWISIVVRLLLVGSEMLVINIFEFILAEKKVQIFKPSFVCWKNFNTLL